MRVRALLRLSMRARSAPSLALLVCIVGCTGVDLFPPPPPLDEERIGVVALAGADLVVLEGSRAQLSARASRSFVGTPALSWSQVEGPPVLLTNAADPLPSFVAPFAPAELMFELRAESQGAVAFDRVRVSVTSSASSSSSAERPGFVKLSGDVIAAPDTTHTFSAGVAGTATPPVAFEARAACGPGTAVSVTGDVVTLRLPPGDAGLPCAVVVDGADADGRGLAPAARIFWPAGTLLPPETEIDNVVGDEGQALGTVLEPDPAQSAALAIVPDDDALRGSLARSWSANGDAELIPGGAVGDDVPLVVPQRAARFVIAVERVLEGASGGVEYAFVETSQGAGNIAPVADGGPDRRVAPGGRFRIDTSGSTDLNGDPFAMTIRQVLGAPALVDDGGAAGSFIAPLTEGSLLFHVVAFDDTVFSAPDPVRVVVSDDAGNEPPVISLPAERYVIPGQVFVVDAGDVEDDSGIIASVTIAQAETDLVPLPGLPAEGSVTLTAGAAGEEYNFIIQAFDDEGAGSSFAQRVLVEDAGPYVDPGRGDDALGTGTAAAPFASVVGALATAARHELDELLLAEGTHATLPPSTVLPSGLSLRGGFFFDDAAGDYAPGASTATVLPVPDGDGLGVIDASLTSLTVRLDGATGSLVLLGSSALSDVVVVDAPAHIDALVVVDGAAAVVISGSAVRPSGAPSPAAVVVEPGAVLRLAESTIAGGDAGADAVAVEGGALVGVACIGAVVAFEGGIVSGTVPVADGGSVAGDGVGGVGVRASDDCSLDLVGARVLGGAAGAGAAAVGIDASATLLTLDAASVVVGAAEDSAAGVAVRVTGRERAARIEGVLQGALLEGDDVVAGVLVAVVDDAIALAGNNALLTLEGAALHAAGTLSGVALVVDGSVLTAGTAERPLFLSGSTRGISGVGADDVTVNGGSIRGGDIAVELSAPSGGGDDAGRSFAGVDIVGNGSGGIIAIDSDVDVVGGLVHAGPFEPFGPVPAVAIAARSVTLRNVASVRANGDGARALVLGDGSSTIDASSVFAAGTAGSGVVGIVHAGPLGIVSSYVQASDTGIESNAALVARHATVVGAVGVRALNGASLDAANSVLAGAPGIDASTATQAWTRAEALAFDSAGPQVLVDGASIFDLEGLEDRGCNGCMIVEVSLFVDDTGHLVDGDNALVDAGDSDLALSDADDIDGDARPAGARPDVGCDERPAP